MLKIMYLRRVSCLFTNIINNISHLAFLLFLQTFEMHRWMVADEIQTSLAVDHCIAAVAPEVVLFFSGSFGPVLRFSGSWNQYSRVTWATTASLHLQIYITYRRPATSLEQSEKDVAHRDLGHFGRPISNF